MAEELPAGNPADDETEPTADCVAQDKAEIDRIGVERFAWDEYDRQTNPTGE